jgi:hypothetical protein
MGVQATGEACGPQKRTSSTSLLNPDPETDLGTPLNPDPIRIRIHSTNSSSNTTRDLPCNRAESPESKGEEGIPTFAQLDLRPHS